MSTLDERTAELRQTVEVVLHQFRKLDHTTINGPHLDLSTQELRVVEYLGDEGPHMMRELAAFLGLAVNSVTSLVDNLEEKQIVRRNRSKEDRRIVRVELTEPGKEAYAGATAEKMRCLRGMLGALTEDEQEIFMVLFRKIARSGRSQVLKLASAE